jgi:prolyl 4-hydroxylase
MQQLQASLVAQQQAQLLEQAAAAALVAQQQQHQLAPALNSLQLNNNQQQSPLVPSAVVPLAAAVAQQQQQSPFVAPLFAVQQPTDIAVVAQQLQQRQQLEAAAAQVAAVTIGSSNNGNIHGIIGGTGNPQPALPVVGINPIIMSTAAGGATAAVATGVPSASSVAAVTSTPSLIASYNVQQQQQQQAHIATQAVVPGTATLTTTPTTTANNVTATTALLPQMTIPHYIPPQPSSWGGQFPTLSVQDRPLVPPIYNGINPNYPGAQLLHAHPPIYCVHNFLSPAECNFLIHAASDAFGPAPVVGRGSGEVSPSRTSSTCYLAREDLPEYMRKITLLTGKPPEHCELPQVGRYYPSQQYLQHFDAFDLSNEDGVRFASNGGQRTITVLTYLNDVPRGGSTAFPNLNIEVRPKQGMALVFFPATLDGLLDKMALHAALPAVDTKYVSQVWVRQSNYDGRPSKRLAEPMVGQQQSNQVQQQLLLGQLQQQQLNLQQQN